MLSSDLLILFVVIVVFLGLLFLFYVKDWSLNTPPPKVKVEKVVTLEGFSSESSNEVKIGEGEEAKQQLKDMGLTTSNSFCKSYSSSPDLDVACHSLTKDNCMQSECCVYTKNSRSSQCRAGDAGGPTFKTETNGEPVDVDTYYYKKKCYGSNCDEKV